MKLRPHIVAAASRSPTRVVAFALAADLTEMSTAIAGRGVEYENEG